MFGLCLNGTFYSLPRLHFCFANRSLSHLHALSLVQCPIKVRGAIDAAALGGRPIPSVFRSLNVNFMRQNGVHDRFH